MTNEEALQVLYRCAGMILHPSIGSLEGRSFWADEEGLKDLERTKARVEAAQKQLAELIEKAEPRTFGNIDALVDSIEKAIIRYADDRITQGGYWPEWHGEGVDPEHVADLRSARDLAFDVLLKAGVSNVTLIENVTEAITQFAHDRLEKDTGYYPAFNHAKEGVPSAQQLAVAAVHKGEDNNEQ